MIQRSLALVWERLNRPQAHPVPWGLRWLPIALVVIEGLLFFAALLFISYWRDSDLSAPDPLTLLWTAFLSSALTIIVTFQYVTGYILAQREEKHLKNDRTVMEWLGLGPSRNTPLWVILLGAMALAVILDTLGLVLGVTETSLPIPLMGINEAVDPFAFFVAALVLVILRPIADELIFRGVFLPALLPLMRPFYAVLASAGLYGLLHFALDPQFVWWGLVLPCVVGLLAGVARLTTQSTQTAIGVSAMFGLWAVLRAIVA